MERLITWSETKLKTDMRYLLKGGFWLAIGRVLFMLNGLIVALALANLLPKSTFGMYQFVVTAATIIGALTISGIGTSIRRAAARSEEGALRFGFHTMLRWNIGMLVIAGIISGYYFYNGNEILGFSFLIIALTVPLIEAFRLYQQYLLGAERFKESTTLGLWCRSLTPISLILVLLLTDNVLVLLFVFYVSTLIATGLSYTITVKKFHLPFVSDPTLVEYGRQLSVINLLRMVANHIDKIIIFQTLGATAMAGYTIAALPFNHLRKSWGTIGKLAFPRFAQHDFNAVQSGMFRKIILFLIMTIFVVFIFIFTAPFLYKITFPAYSESILVSQVLMLALLFKPFTLINQAFQAHKLITEQRIVDISSLFVKIALICTLIPFYGVWGVVAAVLLSSAYATILSLILFYRLKKNGRSNVTPT